VGGRSEADWALVCAAIEDGWDCEALWARVHSIGKFADRGRGYFDLTWSKAEAHVVARGAGRFHEPEPEEDPAAVAAARLEAEDRGARWAESLEAGGLVLDSDACAAEDVPPAVHEAILTRDFYSTLTVCQSRDDCWDLYFELLAVGEGGVDWGRVVHAAIYPSRTPYDGETGRGNCRNFAEVRKAEDLGLPPRDAVCLVCPHKEGCPYLIDLEKAKKAPHAIMTARRAELTELAQAADEKDAVFLVGNRGLDVLVPTLHVGLTVAEAREGLERIATAARDSACNAASNGRDARWSFACTLAMIAGEMRAALGAGGGVIEFPPPTHEAPGWAASLKAIFTKRDWRPPAKLMRACAAAATGRLRALVVRVDGDRAFVHAAWRPRSTGRPTLVLDPTLSAATLEAATGEPVRELHGAINRGAVQVARRITGKSRPGPLAGLIRGYLWTSPGRLGVVLAEDSREPVAALLTDAERERVRLAGWNDDLTVLSDCPRTLVLGHPPVPPEAVRQRLIQTGQAQAATEPGDWGDLPWEAEQPWGEPVMVDRKGYRHPAWQAAYQELVRGRVRAVLANLTGLAIVVTDEDLGLSLDVEPPALDTDHIRLLEGLRGLTLNSATDKREERLLVAEMSVRVKAFHAKELGGLAGLSAATVRRRMADLERAGLVIRVGERGGWLAAEW
jgi:hypothetical protein